MRFKSRQLEEHLIEFTEKKTLCIMDSRLSIHYNWDYDWYVSIPEYLGNEHPFVLSAGYEWPIHAYKVAINMPSQIIDQIEHTLLNASKEERKELQKQIIQEENEQRWADYKKRQKEAA